MSTTTTIENGNGYEQIRTIHLPAIPDYSETWQRVILVLFALSRTGGIRRKDEVIRFIDLNRLYQMQPRDQEPYETQVEARYRTRLAWARKDAALRGWLMASMEKDSWELNRDGRDFLESQLNRFASWKRSIRLCYLWTPNFKRCVFPNYDPACDEWDGPHFMME